MVRSQIVAVVLLIAVESSFQVYRPDMGRPMIIQPTYRPDIGRPTIIHPTYKPGTGRIIYAKRDVSHQKDEPDVNVPENYDINKLKQVNVPERFPRSVDSPSAKRGGGGPRTSGGNRDTGPTHPGYNRRNTRSVDEPIWLWKGDNVDRAPATGDHPFLPKYIDDIKLDPNRRYTRSAEEDAISNTKSEDAIPSGLEHGDEYVHLEDPSINYEDAVEEERLSRNTRSLRLPFPDPYRPTIPTPYNPFPKPFDPRPFPIYARNRRYVQFPGMKKPTHRDVIIPNWNPNVKTNPWDVIKGRRN